jgi:hypothetical protein
MSDTPTLGVVIPLYRQTYLEALLRDLSQQTDKNFALTVVSDGAMLDPSSEISSLLSSLRATVIKFENPVGRDDPSLSWSRAVAQANEDWIWLVGDDDRVGPRCVETFRAALTVAPPEISLFRFPVGILSNGETKRNRTNGTRMGRVLTSRRFLQKRLWGQDLSFASEYVFRYKALTDNGGFVHFPFAWCSDDATWLKLSYPHGIYQLGGTETEVLWREGEGNTSSKQRIHFEVFSLAEKMFVKWLVDESPMQTQATGRLLRIGILRWFIEKSTLKFKSGSELFEVVLPLGLSLGLTSFEVRGVLMVTVAMSTTNRLLTQLWGLLK